MKSFILAFLSIVCSIVLVVLLLVNAIYLEYLFKKYGNFEQTPLSKQQAKAVAQGISSYLLGTSSKLVIQDNEDYSAVLSQRERLHMQDVRNIFLTIRNLAIVLWAVWFVVVFAPKRKTVPKYYMYGLVASIVALGGLAIFAWIDFDRVFILLHKILFTNDLWLLTPGKDFIISMMPLALFQEIAVTGGILVSVFVTVLSYILIKKRKY